LNNVTKKRNQPMNSTERSQLSETDRTRLIGEIVAVLAADDLPPEARDAGLTLVGWLARRRPQDQAPDDASEHVIH